MIRWLLLPLLLAAAYVALRKFFTFRREKRQEKLGAARRLFAALSSTASVVASGQAPPTELSKQQMIAGMAKLGLTVPDNVAFDLLDTMDIDHSGRINAHEIETWMEHDVSRFKVRPPLPELPRVALVPNTCRVG